MLLNFNHVRDGRRTTDWTTTIAVSAVRLINTIIAIFGIDSASAMVLPDRRVQNNAELLVTADFEAMEHATC